MDTDTRGSSWIEPAIVSLALMLPGLLPTGSAAFPGGAAAWLASGAAQALSQLGLLLVIIGARGRLREYGAVRPRARDALAAPALAVAMAALSYGAALVATRASAVAAWLMGARTVAPPEALQASSPWVGGAAAFLPPAAGLSEASLLGLCAAFALAVGYREELFYRLYVIGSLRERGARPIAAALVSTLVFAAGHAYQGVAGVAASLAVGALLASAALAGLGLHALAWAHALYDFIVLLAAFGLLGRS